VGSQQFPPSESPAQLEVVVGVLQVSDLEELVVVVWLVIPESLCPPWSL